MSSHLLGLKKLLANKFKFSVPYPTLSKMDFYFVSLKHYTWVTSLLRADKKGFRKTVA